MRFDFLRELRCLRTISAFVLICGALGQSGCGGKAPDQASLAQTQQELEQLRSENQELQKLRADNQDLNRLKRDNEELLRLRAQTKDLVQLREENDRLRGQLQVLRPSKGR